MHEKVIETSIEKFSQVPRIQIRKGGGWEEDAKELQETFPR